jgi:hypothetical protein
MDTNEESKLLFKNEVFQIVGAAMEVLNEGRAWFLRKAL